MGRPVARRADDPGAPIPPDQWPDRVLTFARGLLEDTTGGTTQRVDRAAWLAERLAWVRAHRPDLIRQHHRHPSLGPFLAEAQTERRRRTLHTEQD